MKSKQERESRLWDLLTALEFVRIGGSAEEEKAAQILSAAVQEAGATCAVEPFSIDYFDTTKAEILWGTHRIPCEAVAFAGTTPAKGLTAPFLYVGDATEDELVEAKGKIVFVNQMFDVPMLERLIKAGAAALLFFTGAVYDDVNKTSISTVIFRNAHRSLLPPPTFFLRAMDAHRLVKEPPHELSVTLLGETVQRISHNVVAECRGTEHPDEVVVFTAHYDTVRNSLGMYDNASGSVILMEILRHFVKHPPKRTVRFVWTGAEERGLLGSAAYLESLHEEEKKKIKLNINIDMAGALLGTNKIIVSANDGLFEMLRYFTVEVGFLTEIEQNTYSSDSITFLDYGIPAVNFSRFTPAGVLAVHNKCDDKEYLSAQRLSEMVGFSIAFTERFTGGHRIPMHLGISEEMKEKLEAFHKRKPM